MLENNAGSTRFIKQKIFQIGNFCIFRDERLKDITNFSGLDWLFARLTPADSKPLLLLRSRKIHISLHYVAHGGWQKPLIHLMFFHCFMYVQKMCPFHKLWSNIHWFVCHWPKFWLWVASGAYGLKSRGGFFTLKCLL